jgi:hypothetical protein
VSRFLSDELHLRSYPYLDEEYWRRGFNDALVDRRGTRWRRLMVLKSDVARFWPFEPTDTYGFPCSRQWLAKLAVVGGGPLYRKAGRTPIYETPELDRWAEARIGPPQRSTSDLAASVDSGAPQA